MVTLNCSVGSRFTSDPVGPEDLPSASTLTTEVNPMRRLLWSLSIAGALAALPAPQPADAFPFPCVDCGSQFLGGGELSGVLTGWCRLLSLVFCPWT